MSWPSRHCESCNRLVVFAVGPTLEGPYWWEPHESGTYLFEPGLPSPRAVELSHAEILNFLRQDEHATFFRAHRCARVRGRASLFEEVA